VVMVMDLRVLFSRSWLNTLHLAKRYIHYGKILIQVKELSRF
jgi:hypothetical protein